MKLTAKNTSLNLKTILVILLLNLTLHGCNTPHREPSQVKAPTPKQPDSFAITSFPKTKQAKSAISPIKNTELLALNFKPTETVSAAPVDLRFHPKPQSKVIKVEPLDLIASLKQGFKLPRPINRRVMAELKFYQRHPEYIARTLKRSERYLHFIKEEIKSSNVPAEIAFLPVVESAFQPFAYSHGRASGLWQFIPSTGKRYGLRQDWWYDGRRDVVASTRAAITYLSNMAKMFNDDWLLALASYNAGSGNVSKAIRRNKKRGKPIDFWHLKLPKETQAYVPKLIAFCMVIDNPEKYGIKLDKIEDKPYFELVDVKSQIDLALVADLAGISLTELYLLNPGFNRWATSPDGPHQLALPVDRAEAFRTKLAIYPQEKRISWVRHKIKRGEALLTIAKKYDTTVKLLRRVNKIKGNSIRAGHHLIVPVALKSEESYALSASQRHQGLLQKSRKGSSKKTHIVRRGDTLWDISRKYRVSVKSLARWNGMAPGDNLKQGQRLVIWTRNKSGTVKVNLPGNTTRRITYTVRSGDSLYEIARRFRVSVNDLRRWNGLKKNGYLQPGQRLKIHVDVTRQSSSA